MEKLSGMDQTEFPPRVSPLVTACILRLQDILPFTEKTRAKSNHTTTTSSGVIFALDQETGEKVWEYNVNASIRSSWTIHRKWNAFRTDG